MTTITGSGSTRETASSKIPSGHELACLFVEQADLPPNAASLTRQDLFQDGRVLDLLVSGQQQRPSYHFVRLGIIIAEGQANATVRVLAFNQI